MDELISVLTDRDDKRAYAGAKEIVAASAASPAYYPYLEAFASLLTHRSSYVRTRAFLLCCSQARWDTEGRLGELLPKLCVLLNDPKPTVVRQCLNALREVALFRPELSGVIRTQLEKIDLSKYRDTMVPLIRKDMQELISSLDGDTRDCRK